MTRPALVPALLAALLLAAVPAAQEPPAPEASAGSLEAYLARIRAEREAEQARLRPQVDELAKRLGTVRAGSELRKVLGDLEALGGEAAPLLLVYLDPGPQPTPDQERQAREIAQYLARTRSPALLEELVRLARVGSPLARALAMRVLGSSPERERALAALRDLHPELAGTLRAECVRAVAELAPGDPLVVAALGDSHPAVLSAALRALAGEPRKEPRAEVVALLADPSRAADVLPDLVDYFCVPGQALNEDIVSNLIAFACREDLAPESRLEVLDGLPRFGVSLSSRLRRELEPLLSSSDSAIKDGALIALTLLRDSRARRDLMKFYDDQVKANASWPLAYQRRGDIHLRIGEYRDAARDYQSALDLHKDSALMPGNRDLWVNLARAYVRDGKLKQAAEALEQFGLPSDLRRTLRVDPDFQPLVEHSRYKSLFE